MRECRCENGSATDISVHFGPYHLDFCVHASPPQQGVSGFLVRAAIIGDAELPIFEDLGSNAVDRTVKQTDGRIVDWHESRNGRQSTVSLGQCRGKIISV